MEKIIKKISKNKRAELTTQQLVVLIILIASFVIILLLLFKLNLRDETNKQICHNSVVLLSKKQGIGTLDCRTTYVCLSGGDSCEAFNYDYEKKISLSEENPEELIKNAIQEEIDDCWWMFGEGKIDYTGVLDYSGYRCAICSTFKFDKKIQEKFPQIFFNLETLDTSEKYLVITGMNKEKGENIYINPPRLIKSSEINLMNPSCKDFITKA
jgi:hypothetical protein